MNQHKGKRLYITGIPTAGKSYLAQKLAEEVGGIAVSLDDFREALVFDERYKKWVEFYLDQDEELYLKTTSPEQMWANLVAQSEAVWPAFMEQINSYADEESPVIFECVNILPHLAHKDLSFPGVCMIGASYEEILARNIEEPRWGDTKELQEQEAKMTFTIERPYYKSEAEKYGIPVFENFDEAFKMALVLLNSSTARNE